MEHITSDKFSFENTCVAFGHFEGLHRGHQEIINKLIEQEEHGLTSVLLNFQNRDDDTGSNKVIYTEDEKSFILQQKEQQVMISYPFSKEIETMEPKEFIKNVLVDRLGVKTIVAGENCRFGHERKGDINALKEYAKCYGYEVVCVENVFHNNELITSDLIECAICEGRLDDANKILGHTYKMFGEVVHGKALGRTVGMPTANLKVAANKIMPNSGVYATMSIIDKVLVKGLTNIGKRPSVDNNDYLSLIHI